MTDASPTIVSTLQCVGLTAPAIYTGMDQDSDPDNYAPNKPQALHLLTVML
jgi:hypothetical protein